MSAVINTEKLDQHTGVQMRTLPGVARQVATIECGVGVVTRRAMEAQVMQAWSLRVTHFS